MLKHLYIENYALIRSLDISFDEGFTAVTGETGAGKSIMLGALGLVLGTKADVKVLLNADKKCIVEAQFNAGNKIIDEKLREHDIDLLQDGLLILRREILPEGRSRCFVNDSPTTLTILKDVSQGIVDIHSQHETLTIGDASFQMDLVDSFAATTKNANGNQSLYNYQSLYREHQQIKKELEELSQLDGKLKEEQDYIKFLYEELIAINPKDGEQEELEKELKELENAGTIEDTLQAAGNLLSDSENSVIHQLSTLTQILKKSAAFHNGIAQVLQRVESSQIELKDIANETCRMGGTAYNPAKIEDIRARLDEIYRLENKHRVNSIGELLALAKTWQQHLEKTQNMDERLHALKQELQQKENLLQKAGEELHNIRQKAVEKLQPAILTALSSLGMERAQLKIEVKKTEHFTKTGMDTVQFLFNANLGGILQPLEKIVSGGEMSRLMLAIKSVINQTSVISTIIFDEIDTGVSGNIAGKVAMMMKDMSAYMQVIAVTHLQQIAARADHHFKVTKREEGNKTLSVIKKLNNDERLNEVAAMMSSERVTAASLAAAEELLSK
jgi:DNA repair protein RecN (Recombination protein N)